MGPGELGDDDDFDALDAEFRPPLHPDDRLWRHPAEMGAARSVARRSARHLWTIAAASAVSGAVIGSSLWFVFAGPSVRTVHVRERVAMQSSATLVRAVTDDTVDELTDPISPAVVALDIDTPQGHRRASAVVMLDDGHLLTPAHLVAGATKIVGTTTDGVAHPLSLVGDDPTSDVAVLKAESARPGTVWNAAVFSTDPLQQAGQSVALIGVDAATGPRVWTGSVLALDASAGVGGRVQQLLVKLSMPVGGVAEGGAIIDGNGSVIGLGVTGGGAGTTGYALPISVARLVAWQIMQSGHATTPWLGIDATGVTGVREDGDRGGVLVNAATAGGPAATAGLRAGDVLIGCEGSSLSSVTALMVDARERGIGSTLTVDYLRNSVRQRATLTIAAAPAVN